MKIYVIDYYDPGAGQCRAFYASKEARRHNRDSNLEPFCGGYSYYTLDTEKPEQLLRWLNKHCSIGE